MSYSVCVNVVGDAYPPTREFFHDERECDVFSSLVPMTRQTELYANKYILAPMVRVGTLPMRLLALEYGAGKSL
jgi:hypothetical protein